VIRETCGDAATGTAYGPNVQALIDLPLTGSAAARHDMTADQFVMWNIAMVKRMPGNPYGNDDEAIAVGLMRGIEFWECYLHLAAYLGGKGP
jgi:hypothetical protein